MHTKETSSDTSLQKHQIPKVHRCAICGNYVKTKKLLVLHAKTCSRPSTTVTKLSKKYPNNKTENNAHGGFLCPECGKSFTKKEYLNKHVNFLHRRTQVTPCSECGKMFTKKSCLKKHIETIHQGIVNYHNCDICGEKYTSKFILKTHQNTVHFKKFNIFCDLCGKGFIYESGLKQHKKLSHDGEVTIIGCTELGCHKTFKTQGSLKYHLNAEHTTEKPELLCGQCGKTFNHPFNYKKHLRFHKKGRQTYTCNVCEKVLSSRTNLNIHLRIHTGERPFVCELCGLCFTRRNMLKGHMVVHTKERPFACKFCDKKYTQRSPLARHLKQVHPALITN